MRGFTRAALAAIAISTAVTIRAQQGPVKIIGLVELSGTGATAGTNFDNGVELAVKEIDAGGGILGRNVEYTSLDTQSQPACCSTSRSTTKATSTARASS